LKKFEKKFFQLFVSTVVNIVLIVLNLAVCIMYTTNKNYSMAVIPFFFAIWFLVVTVMKIIILYIDQYVRELSEKLTSRDIP
jgi:uncharacterized membrane protein HdeD (DUF308 family)